MNSAKNLAVSSRPRHFHRSFLVHLTALHGPADAVFKVGSQEDAHRVRLVAQHIVGTAPNEQTAALACSLFDGIALELEKALFGEFVVMAHADEKACE